MLRRLLRRAARHGKLLGVNDPFLYQVVDTVIHENQGQYPDLREKQTYITKVIRTEEENFAKTIDGGMKIFTELLSAHKEKGAKAAIRLLQNANQVSSVCNDVVGDICGIVSGSTAAVIVTHLQRDLSTTSVLISIGATALISGITIGGKALGKTVAINQCTSVVYRVARIMHALHLSR